MKKKILFLCTILMAMVLYANATSPSAVPAKGEYTTVVEGFDWGPAVNKVILTMDEEISTVEWQNYTVTAEERRTAPTYLPNRPRAAEPWYTPTYPMPKAIG